MLAIVVQAVIRVGKRALAGPALIALAIAAFLALSLFGLPVPVIVAAARVAGLLLGRYAPRSLATGGHGDDADDGPAPVIPDDTLHAERPSGRRAIKVIAVSVALWAAPLLAVGAIGFAGNWAALVRTRAGHRLASPALIADGAHARADAYVSLAVVASAATVALGAQIADPLIGSRSPW